MNIGGLIVMCERCNKVYDRHTDSFRAIHPYLHKEIKKRGIAVKRTVCPACELADKMMYDEAQEVWVKRETEQWAGIIPAN